MSFDVVYFSCMLHRRSIRNNPSVQTLEQLTNTLLKGLICSFLTEQADPFQTTPEVFCLSFMNKGL